MIYKYNNFILCVGKVVTGGTYLITSGKKELYFPLFLPFLWYMRCIFPTNVHSARESRSLCDFLLISTPHVCDFTSNVCDFPPPCFDFHAQRLRFHAQRLRFHPLMFWFSRSTFAIPPLTFVFAVLFSHCEQLMFVSTAQFSHCIN